MIGTINALNIQKTEIAARWIQDRISRPTGVHDIANVTFDLRDAQTVSEIVILENLYRDVFRNLILDIRSGRALIDRLNKNSERKFKNLIRRKYPKLNFIEEEFLPLDYLVDMERFSIMDLQAQNTPEGS